MKKIISLLLILSVAACKPTELDTKVAGLEKEMARVISDKDGDGVSDFFDKDSATVASVKTYGDGTEVDADADGVPDSKDQELFSAKGANTNEYGLEIDSDRDGVPDSRDMEPNTSRGEQVDVNGIRMRGSIMMGAGAGNSASGDPDKIQLLEEKLKGQLKKQNLVFADKQLYVRVQKTILDSMQKLQSVSQNINSENSALLNGTYYLKADSVMQCLKQSPVDVGIIDKGILSVMLNSSLTGQIPQGAVVDQIKVDSIMSAELIDASGSNTDPVFEITPNTSDSLKLIDGDKFTKWHWVVKPLKSGNHKLQLLVKVRKSFQGVSFVDEVVMDKEITVQSNRLGTIAAFIDVEWKWLTTTIFIPVIVWYFKRREKLLEAKIDKLGNGAKV